MIVKRAISLPGLLIVLAEKANVFTVGRKFSCW